MKRLLSRLLLVLALLFILILGSVRIYSRLSPFPEISQWNYQQLQRIDKEKKEFSFIVFGDNRGSVTLFYNLIGKVNEEDAIFSINNGDLVNNGEKEEYRLFIRQIKKAKKPLLNVIGNHELKRNGRGLYYDLFGRFYFSFAVGDSYFIILDNANWRDIDRWQMDWLIEELEKSGNYKNRFVFLHVPLYDPRMGDRQFGHSMKDLDCARKLNDIFDENEITMVFASHIHGYYRGVWGKTPFIITGGAGAPLAGTEPSQYFYHYIKVTVSESGVNYELIKLPKPDFEETVKFFNGLWVGSYIFFERNFASSIAIFILVYMVIYLGILRKRR
jgi:hypothetical protein